MNRKPGFSPGAVREGIFFDVKTDFRSWGLRRWRSHELADGVENRFELGIVFPLEVTQFASKIGIGAR